MANNPSQVQIENKTDKVLYLIFDINERTEPEELRLMDTIMRYIYINPDCPLINAKDMWHNWPEARLVTYSFISVILNNNQIIPRAVEILESMLSIENHRFIYQALKELWEFLTKNPFQNHVESLEEDEMYAIGRFFGRCILNRILRPDLITSISIQTSIHINLISFYCGFLSEVEANEKYVLEDYLLPHLDRIVIDKIQYNTILRLCNSSLAPIVL